MTDEGQKRDELPLKLADGRRADQSETRGGDLDDLQHKIVRARQNGTGGAQEVAVGMGLVFTLGLTVALCLMIGDSSGRWLVERFAVKALYPVTMVASVLVAFGSGYRQIRFFTRAMEKGQK